MGKLNWQNQFDMHQESLKNSTDGTIVVQIILRSETYPWAPGFRVWLEKYYTGAGILCVLTACRLYLEHLHSSFQGGVWFGPQTVEFGPPAALWASKKALLMWEAASDLHKQ